MAAWARRYWLWWAVPVAVVVAAVILGLLLGPVTRQIAGPEVQDIKDKKDRAAALNQVRTTVLQAVGGTAALSALVFTAVNYQLNRRGQLTERYATAIGLLASDKLEERVGAIYALEHVMRESERDHATVVEVLSAFVRENARARAVTVPMGAVDGGRWMHPPTGALDPVEPNQEPLQPTTDVQAALTVIARRPQREEANPVDLRRTDLRGADLVNARLEHAILWNARLEYACLAGARLESAGLSKARLERAFLVNTRLEHAGLEDTHLEYAFLVRARLEHADLRGAHLEHAFLVDARLEHADLRGAHLEHADVRGALFERTNLVGIKLSSDIGLSMEQLASAIGEEGSNPA
ncbi:pentapeptide repeat-containing protein [Nocardiopsis rhodophaea]|uniref:pentapeptide repeat-containing protein n=1 Tax=Nocardiopsis rhodophaea TaxID=280238 RepID=UPI0031E15DD7